MQFTGVHWANDKTCIKIPAIVKSNDFLIKFWDLIRIKLGSEQI
jgi:hypothetical protein